MYKEYRDVSLNGAISQLYLEMSSRHRARHDTIHILRASVIRNTKAEMEKGVVRVRRTKTTAYLKTSTRFPIVKNVHRPESKAFRNIFKAHRPTTAQYRAVDKVKVAKIAK